MVPLPGSLSRGELGRITAAGVDLIDHDKLEAARCRWQGRLEARLFSSRERAELCLDDDAIFDAAFGIKESVIKVFGGLPKGAGFHDIELDRTDAGWQVALRGRLAGPGEATGSGSVVAGSMMRPGLPRLAWAVGVLDWRSA